MMWRTYIYPVCPILVGEQTKTHPSMPPHGQMGHGVLIDRNHSRSVSGGQESLRSKELKIMRFGTELQLQLKAIIPKYWDRVIWYSYRKIAPPRVWSNLFYRTFHYLWLWRLSISSHLTSTEIRHSSNILNFNRKLKEYKHKKNDMSTRVKQIDIS